MADPRKINDRTAFFTNEAKLKRKKRPRVRRRKQVEESEEKEDRGHIMGWDRRQHSADVNAQLHAAGYLTLECIISYTKITEDFATRIWTVEPYSYRYRWLTSEGRWNPPILKKVFFGYDVEADRIKMFVFHNIHDVTITRKSFSPRWEIEIKQEEEF